MMNPAQEAIARAIWDIGAFKTVDHPTAVRRGDERGFLLKSHEKDPNLPLSPFYLNLRTSDNPKPGPLTSDIVQLIAKMMRTLVDQRGVDYNVVAGIPNAGDPFAEQFVALSPAVPLIRLGKGMDTDKRKILGVISGTVVMGQTAIVVDDLITKADSKFEAIESLENTGLCVQDIVVLVDREQGGAQELEKEGYSLHSVFRISELLRFYHDEELISPAAFEQIAGYLFPGLKKT
ncbi:MAG: hypothetical protein WAW00_01825 [Candidatus Moraniibacteriota bacterium]